jgi:ATP-dependent helicase HrpB
VLTLLTSELGHDVLSKLDRLVPTHVKLPGRAKVPVTYEHDRPPWIESRMQDFFGLADGPSAGGAPIVLHLLAPNKRAVQVTTDLAGFWQRHYPGLKKQLSREYPKHFWPDDPLTAEAGPPPKRR